MYKNYNKTINDTQLLLQDVKTYNIGLFGLFSILSFCVLPVFFLIDEKRINLLNLIAIAILVVIFIVSLVSHKTANKKEILFSCFDTKFQSYLQEIETQITYMRTFTFLFMFYCIIYLVLFLIDIPYDLIYNIFFSGDNIYQPIKAN